MMEYSDRMRSQLVGRGAGLQCRVRQKQDEHPQGWRNGALAMCS